MRVEIMKEPKGFPHFTKVIDQSTTSYIYTIT